MLFGTLGLLAQVAAVPVEPDADERLARDVRAAQVRFELTRRASLPREPDHGGSRPCDARVGRFCYWYDSTSLEPKPEPGAIVAARHRLLAALDSAARAAPADPWIAGQLVRYSFEAGLGEEALMAARSCGAERWWCAALEGLVHHVFQRYAAADSTYAVALRNMTAERRCAWFDLRPILDNGWERAFRPLSCGARERLAARLLRLGQPLWITGGDDLRTEHFARLTMALIQDQTAHAYGGRFGADNRELLVRYGWPEWFTRHEPAAGAYATYSITGHQRAPSYHFVPLSGSTAPFWPTAGSWALRDARAASRYAPRHIVRMVELPHQLARFPRGDSMLLVAALAPLDPILSRDRIRSAIGVLDGRGQVKVVGRGSGESLAGLAAAESLVVSVEALGDSSRIAARERYTIAPLVCSTWCLSDLLLVDEERVDTAAGAMVAMSAALPSLRISGDTAVGVYFELTADPSTVLRGIPVTFALSLTPVRVGTMRRLASRLGLVDRPGAVRMRWQAIIDPARAGRGNLVTLRVPESARGRYRMQLTVSPRGAAPVHASREVEIRG